jgi:hypothetical protein
MLTGCTGANTPLERPFQAGAPGLPTLPPAASPSPQPTAAPATVVSPSPTPIAAELPERQGVVAYPVCIPHVSFSCRIWVVNDGTGAHELLPDELGQQWPLAWSAAGCVVCPYPVDPESDPRNPNEFVSWWEPGANQTLWQLVQEDRQWGA